MRLREAPVTLRRAAAADAHARSALNRFVHDLHLARRPDYFKPTTTDEVAAWFTSLLVRPTTVSWIAEEDGVPIGYVLALLGEHAENAFRRGRRWCEIDQLAVDPRWRRHGVGTRLVECVQRGRSGDLPPARLPAAGHPARAIPLRPFAADARVARFARRTVDGARR